MPKKRTGINNELSLGYRNRDGLRRDGTPKGLGYFGPLERPDGRVSTELSIGVEFDGQKRLIPLLVPTLAPEEVRHLLGGGAPNRGLIRKAVIHARERIANKMSPFKD